MAAKIRYLTTHDLLYAVSVKIAELYSKEKDWARVRKISVEENIPQQQTLASAKRYTSEIISRLQTLSQEEIQLLLEGSPEEQRIILWLAVCRYFKLIDAFMLEVVAPKYHAYIRQIVPADFNTFFAAKAAVIPELAELSDDTRNRYRRALFQILKEAGLYDGRDMLLPVVVTPRIKQLLQASDGAAARILF